VFYSAPTEAEEAGFRPCRRCRPQEDRDATGVDLARRACRYIEEHADEPLTLAVLGGQLGVSPYHLQRTFKRVTGVTPRQYADTHRMGLFKERLKEGDSVTTAIYEAGYGSSSRLYERTGPQLGMTPKVYRRGGAGMEIRYTTAACPLGYLLLAATERGICFIGMGDSAGELEQILRAEYAAAEITRDDRDLQGWLNLVVRYLEGSQPHIDLPLDVQATAFQRRVWEELRAIPYGSIRTYADIAQALDQPTAARAVGAACAANPVSLVVPCHRAVRRDGSLGGYRWGLERKQALIERERSATREEELPDSA
jgi:AraC family transcriptional regulator of adaptative response/methylated-DNA-[protein]-cysteine methyltransferase